MTASMAEMSSLTRAPVVTVVVPTHNRKDLLQLTLESILNQTFGDFEVIVVSDGSTDGTDEMVSSIADPRLRFIRQQKSGQPAAPRNTGMKCARGRYVALCDDDDLWMQDKLAVQVEAMEANPQAMLCYSNGVVFRDGEEPHGRLFRRRVFRNHFRHLLSGNVIANSSVLMRAVLFEHVGYIDQDPRLRGIEDYEYWLRIAHRFPLLYLDEPLIRYRLHKTNITSSRARETKRAIGVVRKTALDLKVPPSALIVPLATQFAKYCIYRLWTR